MFGLGMQELILIFVVALIFIGPKKLPDIAKALGKAMREFRSATDDIKQNFDLDPAEFKPRASVKSAKPPPPESKMEAEEISKSHETENDEKT